MRMKSTISTLLRRALAAAAISSIAAAVVAGPFYATQAWKLPLSTVKNDMAFGCDTDSLGNVYTVYSIDYGTYKNLVLARATANGQLSMQRLLPLPHQGYASAAGLQVGPGDNIYVASQFTNSIGTTNVWIAKYSYAGALLWSKTIAGVGSASATAAGFAVDSSSVLHVAINYSTGAPKDEVLFRRYDSLGNQLGADVFDTDISAASGGYVNGHWVLTGQDNLATTPSGGERWGEYSDTVSNSQSTRGFAVANSYNLQTQSVVRHILIPIEQIDGSLNLIQDTTSYASGALTGQTYILRHYGPTGGPTFTYNAPANAGVLYEAVSATPTSTLYGILAQGSGATMTTSTIQMDSTGAPVWKKRLGNQVILVDAIGIWGFAHNSSNNYLELRRFDLSGNLLWADAVVGNGTQDNLLGGFKPDSKGFYLICNISNTATTGYDIWFLRYVQGITEKSFAAPASIKGGTTGSVTVTLNGPAPAGGVNVSLYSNNPLLTFVADGKQSYILTVPAGQTSATTGIKAGTVAANTVVTLNAIQSGVNRPANITITP